MTAATPPRHGLVSVVGIGPGDPGTCTPAVADRVHHATDLVGYGPYVDMVAEAVAPRSVGGRRHASGNRVEADRARHALDLAATGGQVAVVSSGDPGVFAMAAALMEQLDVPVATPTRWDGVEVEVLAGVSAAQAAAARVGAPLGHDFCVVSLSDNLKPWSVVEARLSAAAGADFVIALYNPVSRRRPWQLARAAETIAAHRAAATPVVVARDVGRPGETVRLVPLGELADTPADMRTVVIVGSSTTRRLPTRDGWLYTPRAYPTP